MGALPGGYGNRPGVLILWVWRKSGKIYWKTFFYFRKTVMKYSLCLLSLLFVKSLLFGQGREVLKQNTFNSASFKPYEIGVKKKWFDSVKLNFTGDIEFIDKRADESKLGFVRMGEDNLYFNLLFPGQNINYVNASFHHIIKPANNNTRLKIVIRHLWLSQIVTEPTSKWKDDRYLCFCYFKADYYREANGMVQFAGELDTVLSIRKWMGHANDDLMKRTLLAALAQCDSLPLSSNPSYPLKLLNDSLDNQFNYPILKTRLPKKGIYSSYEDFLNDNPREENYEVKTRKGFTYLVSEGADTSVTNAAWGFCDGKDVYKHLNESYYKMNRVQHTFELAGPRKINDIFSKKKMFFAVSVSVFFKGLSGFILIPFLTSSDEKYSRELVPYQLNIQEGTFY